MTIASEREKKKNESVRINVSKMERVEKKREKKREEGGGEEEERVLRVGVWKVDPHFKRRSDFKREIDNDLKRISVSLSFCEKRES